jgi:hypothetical protein
MAAVAERLPADAELALVAWTEQMRLQADRPVTDFGFKTSGKAQWRSGAAWLAEAPATRWVLARADTVPECVDAARVIDVGLSNRRAWALVPGMAVAPRCNASDLD